MKFMKPLNTKGFGHVELVIAVLFIGLFAFVGVRIMGVDHAASLTSSQCTLLGRTWNSTSGACNKVCAANQGSYVVTSTYDYCSAAVTAASKMSSAACTSTYGRKSLISSTVYVGCARHAPQTAGASYANAIQCATAGQTYYVQSTYDRCGPGTSWTAIPTPYAKLSFTPAFSGCVQSQTATSISFEVRAVRPNTTTVSQTLVWAADLTSGASNMVQGRTWTNNTSVMNVTMPKADYLVISYQTSTAGYAYTDAMHPPTNLVTCK